MATKVESKAHKATVAVLQILLILIAELYVTAHGWNAIEGWLLAGAIAIVVSVIDGVVTGSFE